MIPKMVKSVIREMIVSVISKVYNHMMLQFGLLPNPIYHLFFDLHQFLLHKNLDVLKIMKTENGLFDAKSDFEHLP